MKHYTTVAVCCVALAALSVHAQVQAQVQAQASTAKEVTGPYIGAAFGAAFGNREIDDSNSSNDEHMGRSSKIYGGYQNVAFSVELERCGKISYQVKGNTLAVGTRFTF